MGLGSRGSRRPERGWVAMVLVGLVVLFGGCAGGVSSPTVHQPSDTSTAEPTPSPSPTPTPNAIEVSAVFCRGAENAPIVNDSAHDPMMIRGDGGDLYLVASRVGNRSSLWRATDDAGQEWRMVDREFLPAEDTYDSIVRVGDRYLIYGNEQIWAAPNLTGAEWVNVGATPQNDLGAYYDGDRVHIYYERGNDTTSRFSGSEIRHATSPTGTGNWTVHDPVYTAPGPYGVGDFEVVTVDEQVVIFGDYSTSHPGYEQRVWVSDNFYDGFSMVSRPAIEPREGVDTGLDDYGVGDPTIAALADGRYLMVANGYSGPREGVYLHAYVGSIEVTSTTGGGTPTGPGSACATGSGR